MSMFSPISVIIDGEIFARTQYGGVHRVFDRLLRAWRESGQVSVRLHLPAGVDAKPYANAYGDVAVLPRAYQLRPRGFFKRINQKLMDQVAHHWWSRLEDGIYMSTYYTTHAGLRIPQVVVVHDMIYERMPDYFSHVAAQRHCDDKARCVAAATGIICPSRHAQSEVDDLYLTSHNKKQTVIPYAVDPVFFSPPSQKVLQETLSGWGMQDAYLLVTGSHAPHKNFYGLLAAFSRWAGRDRFKILSLGSGPLTSHETAVVDALGLRGRVQVIPYVSAAELVVAYYGARAVVVPSFCEGYGFPVIEAMATGTPVASSTGGSLPEVGQDVPCYFDPFDTESMCRALTEAVEIRSASPRLERGLTIARQRDWKTVADEYAAFLCEVQHV